jgi:hypothetical protein
VFKVSEFLKKWDMEFESIPDNCRIVM